MGPQVWIQGLIIKCKVIFTISLSQEKKGTKKGAGKKRAFFSCDYDEIYSLRLPLPLNHS